MPAYFTLTKKGEKEPSAFAQIDDEMREHFGAPADATNWYESWYDIEGFRLALGRTWEEMRQATPNRIAIINWLEENYIADAWYSRS